MSIRFLKGALLLTIRGYQKLVSPLLPPSCRFQPTCSVYAVDAIERHGAMRGSGLALKRILRCHPWSPGGYDPVPPIMIDSVTEASDELRSPDSRSPNLGNS